LIQLRFLARSETLGARSGRWQRTIRVTAIPAYGSVYKEDFASMQLAPTFSEASSCFFPGVAGCG
jgi:hypothetical protein